MRRCCSGSRDHGVCQVALTQWTRPPLPVEEHTHWPPPEPEHDAPPRSAKADRTGPIIDDPERLPPDRDKLLPFPFTIPIEVRTYQDSLGLNKQLVGVEGSEVYAVVRDHFALVAPGKSATSEIPGPAWSQDRGLPPTPPVRIIQRQAPFDPWDPVRFHYGDIHVQVEGSWLEEYIQDPSSWPTEAEVLEAYLPEYVQASREDAWLPPWGELVLEPMRGCWNLPRTNTDFLFWRGNTWGAGYMVLEHALRLIGAFWEHAQDKDSGFEAGADYHRWLRTLISGRNKHPTTGRLFATLCPGDHTRGKKNEGRDPDTVRLGQWGGITTSIRGAATPYISLRGEDSRFPDAGIQVVPGGRPCGEKQGFDKFSPKPWDYAWYEPVRKTTQSSSTSGLSTTHSQQFYWLPRGSLHGDLDHCKPAKQPWPAERQRAWPEWLWGDGGWVQGNSGDVLAHPDTRQLNLRASRLHFEGLITDELLWWAAACLRYSEQHPTTPQPGKQLARFAFYRILQWSSLLLHELGHVYCNPGYGGHCRGAKLFMNHSRGRFLCKVTKLLGFDPTSVWDPGYGNRAPPGFLGGWFKEERQSVQRYVSKITFDGGQEVACVVRRDGGLDHYDRVDPVDGQYTEKIPSYNPSWCRILNPGQSLAEEETASEGVDVALTRRARFYMPQCKRTDQNLDVSYTNPSTDCEDLPVAGLDLDP